MATIASTATTDPLEGRLIEVELSYCLAGEEKVLMLMAIGRNRGEEMVLLIVTEDGKEEER